MARLSTAAARLSGRAPRAPLDAVRMARRKMFVKSAKAEREIGFTAAPAEEAFERAIRWFRDKPVLLIVGADRREFAAFDRIERTAAVADLRWQARTVLPSGPALLVAHGPGRENAAHAVLVVCAQQPVAAVISHRFCRRLE